MILVSEHCALGLLHAGRHDLLACWTALEVDDPDLRGEVYLALLRSCQTYDPSQGSWHTYASRVKRWCALRAGRGRPTTLGELAGHVPQGEDRPRVEVRRCLCGEVSDGRAYLCEGCRRAVEVHGRCAVCGVPRFKQKSRRLCAHVEGRP